MTFISLVYNDVQAANEPFLISQSEKINNPTDVVDNIKNKIPALNIINTDMNQSRPTNNSEIKLFNREDLTLNNVINAIKEVTILTINIFIINYYPSYASNSRHGLRKEI